MATIIHYECMLCMFVCERVCEGKINSSLDSLKPRDSHDNTFTLLLEFKDTIIN